MANVWRPVFLLALLLAATSARAADPDRQIAVTFDDLPWASLDPNTPLPPSGGSVPADIRAQSTKLLADIRAAGTPAIGFVKWVETWYKPSTCWQVLGSQTLHPRNEVSR